MLTAVVSSSFSGNDRMVFCVESWKFELGSGGDGLWRSKKPKKMQMVEWAGKMDV